MTRRKRTVKVNREGLTRREELYLSIISLFISRHLTTQDGNWLVRTTRPDKHDARLESEYEVGDLVLTHTSIGRRIPNKWNVAIVHEKIERSACVLRDIFTGELCNYGNESFEKIVGVPFYRTLSDDQHQLWEQFRDACIAVDDYFLRPIYAEFGEETATYRTREKWTDDTCEFEFSLVASVSEMETRLRDHVNEVRQNRGMRSLVAVQPNDN